jgi:hypothetical protein
MVSRSSSPSSSGSRPSRSRSGYCAHPQVSRGRCPSRGLGLRGSSAERLPQAVPPCRRPRDDGSISCRARHLADLAAPNREGHRADDRTAPQRRSGRLTTVEHDAALKSAPPHAGPFAIASAGGCTPAASLKDDVLALHPIGNARAIRIRHRSCDQDVALREISEARIVFVEELHAPHGIGRGQVARHTPVEEPFRTARSLSTVLCATCCARRSFTSSMCAGVIFANSPSVFSCAAFLRDAALVGVRQEEDAGVVAAGSSAVSCSHPPRAR